MSDIEKARGYARALEELWVSVGRLREETYNQCCTLSFGPPPETNNGKRSRRQYEILSQEACAAIASIVEAEYNARILATSEKLVALGVDINQ